jgi:hypothetical protein
MKRLEFIAGVGGVGTALPIAATAQQNDSGRQVRLVVFDLLGDRMGRLRTPADDLGSPAGGENRRGRQSHGLR